MSEFNKFLDKEGLLIQKNDRGHKNAIDCMFLTCNTIYQKALTGDLRWFNSKPIEILVSEVKELLQHDIGVFRRYHETWDTEEGAHYTDPRTLSRDNILGMLILLGKFGFKADVRAAIINVIKRGSFFQNTRTNKFKKKIVPDFCGLSQWSILLRAGMPKWALVLLIPLLLVCDVFFMLSLIFHVLKSYYDPTYASTVYHEVSACFQAKDVFPTPFTAIGSCIFLKFRRPVEGYPAESGVISALKYYSRNSFDPPIFRVSRKLIDSK